METQLIVGFVLAFLIGISLGLVGSGGAILTVPVLVYVIGLKPELATAYSLFVVGCTAAVGAATYARRKALSYRTAFAFALPSLLSVFLVRKWLLPAIPQQITPFLSKDLLLMLLFAALMLGAAYAMLTRKCAREQLLPLASVQLQYGLLAFIGFVVGLVTGFVGAGGGFLMVPALVLLARLPMPYAVGTSLFIIAINAFSGFAGDLIGLPTVNWALLLPFTGMAIGGIALGTQLGKKIEACPLRKGFGWFVVAIGVFVIGKELFW